MLPINKMSPTQMLVIESPLQLLACNITLHRRSILRSIAGYRTARGRSTKGQVASRSAREDVESFTYYANCPPHLGRLLFQFNHRGPRYSFLLSRTALTLDVLPLRYLLTTNRCISTSSSSSSSSSVALQAGVGLGLLYNMPPGISIPCSVSPFVYPQLSQVRGHVIQPSHFWSSSSSCCIQLSVHLFFGIAVSCILSM